MNELNFIGAETIYLEGYRYALYRGVLFEIGIGKKVMASLSPELAAVTSLPAEYNAATSSCFEGEYSPTEKILALYKRLDKEYASTGVSLLTIYRELYKNSEVGSSTH